jgi:hypothetical protein
MGIVGKPQRGDTASEYPSIAHSILRTINPKPVTISAIYYAVITGIERACTNFILIRGSFKHLRQMTCKLSCQCTLSTVMECHPASYFSFGDVTRLVVCAVADRQPLYRKCASRRQMARI